MRTIALTLTGLCVAMLLSAQPCGTVPPLQPELNLTYDKEAVIGESGADLRTVKRVLKGRTSVFMVQFYIVFEGELPKKLMLDDLNKAIEVLNHHFSGAGVLFRQEKAAIEIRRPDLAFFDMPSEEESIDTFKHRGKKIHIFLVNSIKNEKGAPIDGYTYNAYDELTSPRNNDILVITSRAVTDGSTLSHEMGHFFGLKHTHEFAGTGRAELVERQRCKELGDGICDTPADPDLSAWVYKGKYTGEKKDAEGNPFSPMVDNLMSYAPARFRHQFTPGQLRKIEQTALFKRGSLIAATTTEKGARAPYISDITLAGAFEQFRLIGGPDKVLLLVQKDSSMWSSRMTRELTSRVQHDSPFANLVDYGGKFTLILYDADQPNANILDFIGNNLFHQPNEFASKEYEWLSRVLRQELVEFPGLIVLQFTNNIEFDYQIVGFFPGYWKPDEVSGLLDLYSELPLLTVKNK